MTRVAPSPIHVATEADASPESIHARIARLQAEIRGLCCEQAAALGRAMSDLETLSAQVAENTAQPPGVRDLTRQLAEDLGSRVQTLEAILFRN